MAKSPKSTSFGVDSPPAKSTEGSRGSPNAPNVATRGKVLELYANGKTVKQIQNHHSMVDSGITETEINEIISKSEDSYQNMAKRQATLLVREPVASSPALSPSTSVKNAGAEYRPVAPSPAQSPSTSVKKAGADSGPRTETVEAEAKPAATADASQELPLEMMCTVAFIALACFLAVALVRRRATA
jgi:hypothetical protein